MVPVKGSGYRGFVFGFFERWVVGEQFRIGLFCVLNSWHMLYNRCDDSTHMKEVVKITKITTLRAVIHFLYIFLGTFMYAMLFRSDDNGMGNIEK
ncbi:hypothetical protein YH65_07800 [Sulfurovum lithotrophicum]|uniref:Uncharacterized protein n=1 Tax=Sulfurovum lithotrophicum TaxID=206403 RepID=A0A7U4M1T3_9BACT|nr:hypothetical protein YH65_07800 [Sulfurovum lithotrophicum]